MKAIGHDRQTIFWHRELPPISAMAIEDHALEVSSRHVEGTLDHRGELWDQCYQDLMARARERLAQEIARLGGHYAHILDESIDTHRDDAKGEAWLQGRFKYMLYREPAA
jgi:hypothetical protein